MSAALLRSNSVEVRARVSGYLEKVHFTDGQNVKEGDLLFTIDRRPFQNAVDQARATLTQQRANLAYAEADLVRGQQLVRDKTITEQTFEQRQQAKRTAEAIVLANEALLRQAELDFHFSELRAPISGRIGDRRVSPGNLVLGSLSSSTTLLATIVTNDPIRFEFTFDEGSYLRYERIAKSGTDVASRGVGVPVSLKLIDEPEFGHRGRMDFLDNAIDRATGTIRGRAVFRNLDTMFTPGHVRAGAGAGVAALRRIACSGCRRSAPSRSANSSMSSAPTTQCRRNSSRSGRSAIICVSSRTGCFRPTA